jgi:hypothetical protein
LIWRFLFIFTPHSNAQNYISRIYLLSAGVAVGN